MSCFQTIKEALDVLYTRIPATSEKEKDNIIKQALNQLQDDYRSLYKASKRDLDDYHPFDYDPFDCDLPIYDGEAQGVDYSDLATKFAYVYKYVASHADIVYQLINKTPKLRELFGSDKLSVSSIGGGPGSDILGILKFAREQYQSPHINYHIYDRESSWTEVRVALIKEAIRDFFPKPTGYFTSLDASDMAFTNHDASSHINLLTMIYFLSEVYANKDKVSPFLNYLFDNLKPGARVIFVDNGTTKDFYEWFDDIIKDHGLEPIAEEDSHNFRLGSKEEKTHLEPYYTKFSKFSHDPKLSPTIAYRICCKL